MSYILDALKKADAERERGGVPGLHARPATAATAPRNTSQRTGVWLALTAALAVAGAVVALSPAPVVQQSAPAITAPAPAPTVSIAESRVAPAPAAAKPEPRKPPRPAVRTAANAKPASSKLEDTPAAAASAVAVAVAPLLGELPQDIRSQIPALAISGSVYSDNPSQRLLLVNGQVLPQGSAVAPDVTLVEIRVGSSEFSFRGTRFRLAH